MFLGLLSMGLVSFTSSIIWYIISVHFSFKIQRVKSLAEFGKRKLDQEARRAISTPLC